MLFHYFFEFSATLVLRLSRPVASCRRPPGTPPLAIIHRIVPKTGPRRGSTVPGAAFPQNKEAMQPQGPLRTRHHPAPPSAAGMPQDTRHGSCCCCGSATHLSDNSKECRLSRDSWRLVTWLECDPDSRSVRPLPVESMLPCLLQKARPRGGQEAQKAAQEVESAQGLHHGTGTLTVGQASCGEGPSRHSTDPEASRGPDPSCRLGP